MFQSLVNHSLRQKEYFQIGRFAKFFLSSDRISIKSLNLFAWPGYCLSTKLSTQGIFLNVESCTKFVNMSTILDQYHSHLSDGYQPCDFFTQYDSSDLAQPRKTILAMHNSRSYQVDGMTSEFSPDTFRFQLSDGSQVSMTQYFFTKYNIKLSPKQPLLFVNYNTKDRVYLPSQLCHEASLPPDFTSNVFKMREI